MPESSRQLAAIMFTDIVGYTALMGKDSAKALELVRLSKEIQKPLVEKHSGKWLKEIGDGAMAKFSTALDAVNCAVEDTRLSSLFYFHGLLKIPIICIQSIYIIHLIVHYIFFIFTCINVYMKYICINIVIFQSLKKSDIGSNIFSRN